MSLVRVDRGSGMKVSVVLVTPYRGLGALLVEFRIMIKVAGTTVPWDF